MYSFIIVTIAPALAQNLQSQPRPAAEAPAYDFGIGYVGLRMPIPDAGHVNLNGVDVNTGVDFSWRWGVQLDSNFARASNILNLPHDAYLMSLQGGPVFYPLKHGGTRVFMHALGGLGLVDGAVSQTSTTYLHGWVTRPSYAFGGGFEHLISGPIAIRLSGDYLRTEFFNHADVLQPQNDLRITAGIVFTARRSHE